MTSMLHAARGWAQQLTAVRLLLHIAALLTAVLIGLAISIDLPLLAIVVVAPFVVFFAFAALESIAAPQIITGLFWVSMGCIFVPPIAKGLAGIGLSFFAELALFAVVPFAIRHASALVRREPDLKPLVILAAVFLAWLCLCSLFGRSRPLPAGYQLITDTKIFILVMMGLTMTWGEREEQILIWLLKWCWPLLLAFCVFQLAAPGRFRALYGSHGYVELTSNPLVPGITRIQGPFGHSSTLSTISLQFALLSGVFAHHFQIRGLKWAAAAYLGLALLSGQRQELLAFLIAVGLLVVNRRYQLSLWSQLGWAAVLGALSLVVTWPFLGDNIMREFARWQPNKVLGAEGARAALYGGSLDIAEKYFPLGSGLGTFGGAGAAKFDTSLYVDAGLGGYWWFRQGLFLMDSYWSCQIAEGGYIGALLLLAFLLAVVQLSFTIFRESHTSAAKAYGSIAFTGTVYALLISPTAFVLSDPSTALIPFTFVGIALTLKRRAR